MNRREFLAGAVLTLAGRAAALPPAPTPAPKSTLAEEQEARLTQIEEDDREVWRQTLKCFLEAGGPAIRWCCLDPVQDGYRFATIHLRDDETTVFRWKRQGQLRYRRAGSQRITDGRSAALRAEKFPGALSPWFSRGRAPFIFL